MKWFATSPSSVCSLKLVEKRTTYYDAYQFQQRAAVNTMIPPWYRRSTINWICRQNTHCLHRYHIGQMFIGRSSDRGHFRHQIWRRLERLCHVNRRWPRQAVRYVHTFINTTTMTTTSTTEWAASTSALSQIRCGRSPSSIGFVMSYYRRPSTCSVPTSAHVVHHRPHCLQSWCAIRRQSEPLPVSTSHWK